MNLPISSHFFWNGIFKIIQSAFTGGAVSGLPDFSFRIYNKEHKNGSLFTFDSDKRHLYDRFRPGQPCVFVTHGWSENIYGGSVEPIISGYVENTEMNAVAYDWNKEAGEFYSTSAFLGTKKAGELLGDMVIKLARLDLCPLETTHLIGHSLGGHVAGIAGYTVHQNTGQKVKRITALDPAGPLFEQLSLPLSDKLDPSDANFVDVIHTNAGIFGYTAPIGDVDFYPNGGGPHQPGCIDFPNYFCSHWRSYNYYRESIYNNEAFEAVKCDSYQHFRDNLCDGNNVIFVGPKTAENASGKYYFYTRPTPFYSIKAIESK